MLSRGTDSASGPFKVRDVRNSPRAALLVRCSTEEAQLIREAAKAERRTISAYLVHAALQRARDEHGV